jgi:hypothetical protein
MTISSSNNTSNDGHTPAKKFKGLLPSNVSESDEQLPKSDVTILHLPRELLEIIFEHLTFHEITNIREVSRRFRDVGNHILNHYFCGLKTVLRLNWLL